MSDAQIWTVIGGFFAILVASQGLILRVVATEIRGIKAEFRSEILAAIAPLTERITRLEEKVASLDTDVQALANRWGRGEM